MDGVEALEGVAILAASSRPDLIDPALLRPGRLDRLVLCPMPGLDERKDILTRLSGGMPLGSDVDLDAISGLTEGLCGADLRGLLTGAEILAVRELDERGEGGDAGLVISQRHLLASRETAHRSVSGADLARLNGVYESFARGGAGRAPGAGEVGTRTALM